ncbi:hypothetical protein C2S52_010007 [Perilla frutescens var. hirtella]|nr:hypothetical protein C2S52_010007 [Perilla frutescens var. hirtella]KAH6816876.1 hypothetical protein C2S51_000479 [Perilla frutescens var. frutescens]
MKGCGCYIAMVATQVAYGGSNVLVKLALERGLNQMVFVVYRHILATLLLFPFAYVLERKERPSLSFSSMAKIFFLAPFGTTIHINVYYAGMHYTSPVVASALTNVIPSLTIAIAVLLGMESLRLSSGRGRAKVVGTLICIGGSLIFTFWKGESVLKTSGRGALLHVSGNDEPSGHQHQNWLKGSLLILISFVSWSIWLILQAMVYKIYPALLSLNVLICFFAALQSSIGALFWGRNPDIWKIGWDVQLLAIVYCGVVISALVCYLQIWCISKNGPVFASMFSPLQLLIVGLFSAIAFGETLHLGSLIGAAIIIVGMYCVLWGKQKEEPKTIIETNKDDDDGAKIIDMCHTTDHK